MGEVETLLLGGTANRGLVVRVGDTVRRPLRPSSPATHALLEHLDRAGFDGAPRLLGIDSTGREVLSYLPGETVTAPYPAWSMTDSALASVARLLRRYHSAVADFSGDGLQWAEPVPAEYVDGLPNLCGSEPRIQAAVAAGQEQPVFAGQARVDITGIDSAFAVALHMHQPLIPAGGPDLGTAAVVSNLQWMLEHPDVGDNHNAPVFHWCYKRMGELIPQLLAEGSHVQTSVLVRATRGFHLSSGRPSRPTCPSSTSTTASRLRVPGL